jgi:hypothetical protein
MNSSSVLTARTIGHEQISSAVTQLLEEARSAEMSDRRATPRHPYFQPVAILSPDRKQKLSAFSREISASGIGMMHYMPVNPGEVMLTISSPTGAALRVRTEILWCRPCGEGWHLSGGRFLELAEQVTA